MEKITADKVIKNFDEVFKSVIYDGKVYKATSEDRKAILMSEERYRDLINKVNSQE